ncbi:Vomp family autotransporter [Bartonella kosoyi]|nr:Vomp family autotransporter [Bartonella kosoyi]
MKELSIISKRNDWDYGHFSQHLFKNLLLGTIIVAFLSNTSPVYAKNFDRIEQLLQVLEKATAVYSQRNNRNVFSDYNRYNPHTGFFDDTSLSKSSYLTVLTTAIVSRVSTSSSYVDFLITTLSKKGKTVVNVLDKDSSSTQKNLEPSIDDNHGNGISLLNTLSSSKKEHPIQVNGRPFAEAKAGSNATFLGTQANASGERSVAVGFKAQATGKFAVTMGDQAEAKNENSIAIGNMAHALGKSSTALGSEYNVKSEHGKDDYTTAMSNYSTALGSVSKALEYGTTAVGHRAYATEEGAVSIGFYSRANKDHSVALGADSIANVASGVAGYNPLLRNTATEGTFVWKSTYGAVSVGDVQQKKTRQIGGVSAGSANTDAVNVAQLKSLQTYVDKGWKLSVDGKNATAVEIDGTVNFAAGSDNLDITKGESDNNIKFDLAKKLALDSIKAGTDVTVDATGLIIESGPQITTEGINAGSKKITNVEAGTADTDAVNVAQLNSLQTHVDKGWKLSVNGNNATAVEDGTVDFAAGSSNFEITKGESDNNIKFDLAKKLTLESIKVGTDVTVDATGLTIADGPQITTTGINAGSKKITNVATGTDDTDAVNVAQLNSLQTHVNKGWKLSVNDKNTKAVGIDGTVDFAAGSSNFEITKGESDNKVKFDLAKNLTLESVKADANTFDATGLIIKDGPKIMMSGIDAGNKKITGLVEGSEATDAVNFSQLQKIEKEVEQQVVSSSFVKQDAETKHITIGKNTDGTIINLQNKDNGNRTISGVMGGAISKDSIEAVNGSQLYETNDKVATYFGGGASYEGGAWNAPTFNIKIVKEGGETENKEYHDVAEALTGVSTSITNVQNKFTKQINDAVTNVKGDSLVKWNDETKLIKIGGEKEGAEIDITNKNGDDRTILGVKSATKDNEAVNFSQLKELKEQVASSSFVKQNAETQHITIGKDTGGDKVDIANNENEKRTLTGIKAGALLADSNEAVIGSQLFATNNDVTTLKNNFSEVKTSVTGVQTNLSTIVKNTSQYLGGDADVLDGKAPTYTVEGKSYHDVASAFSGVSHAFTEVKQQMTNVNNSITNVENQIKNVESDSLVKQDEHTQHITIGKDTKGDKIDIANKNNEKRTLTGIKEGAISKDSNEAVTGSQLFTTNQNVTAVSTNLQTVATNIAKSFGGSAKYENGKWSTPTFMLKTVKDDGSSEEKIYNNVTDALSGVGTSFTNIQKQVTEQINHVINKVESENLVQKEKATNNITIGAKIEGSIINIANKNGEARALSGVKEATKENEAVNKGQLDTSIKDFNNEITNKFNDFTKSITNITQQVKGDALLWDKDEKAFVADHGEGSAKTNSKITHLLDGVISSNSKDAITGSQLYSLGNAVSTSLGGGASYEEGSWIAPTFTVNKFDIKGNAMQEDYKTVADALSGLSTSFTNIQNKITHEISKIESENLVKQDDKTKLIMVGGEKDGTVINIANKNGEARALSGVKEATQENEAVNKTQLDKLDKKIESTNSFAVFYDKQSDDTVNYKSVTFGGKNKEPVALHNVANGVLSQESHDAINGGQITKIFQQVVKYFGGNAAFKEGIFTGPIYKLLSISENGAVGETDHDNIVSAFEGLDTNIKNVNKRIKEVSAGISDDSLLWDKNKEAYVALHGEGETRENSKITNLKDGDITANSSDAVNGSQLYSLNEQLATYFGGGAGYDKQGNWQAPNFKIKQFGEDGASEEKSYSNISDALSGIGNSFTNIQNKITHEISKIESENLVKQDEKTKRITIGGEKDGSELSIANSASGVRSLSGVKAGLLIEESTEAINGSQLYSVINVLSRYFSGDAGYKDGKWLAPGFKVAQFTAAGVLSKKENYTNVASAFEGVNESMTKINNRIHDFEQSVFSGGLNWSETEKAFDARHKGQDSKIKHVADGEISEGSKEAINGRQLWQTNKKVKEVESHVNMIDKQVKDIASVADIAVKYDKGTDGKKTNKVTLVGLSESDPVLIDNVAEGRIESGSKEAVTGGQLHDYTNKQMNLVLSNAKKYTNERFKDIVNNTVDDVIHETKSYTDVKFEALRYEIKEVRKESKQAAAIGLAVSNLSYEETPGSLSLSIGTGTWRNQSAFAVGAGYMSENGRIRSNISATSSGRHWGIGAGLRVKLN